MTFNSRGTRIVVYIDDQGRKYNSLIPARASDEDAAAGILVGPPDVADEMGIPEPWATRLHNALWERGLFSLEDVRRQPGVLGGVFKVVFRADVAALLRAFERVESDPPEAD